MDVRIDNPSAVRRLARAAAKSLRRESTADGTLQVHEEALPRLFEVARRHGTLRAQPGASGGFTVLAELPLLAELSADGDAPADGPP